MFKVVTANILATGRVVFQGSGGTWVEAVADAIEYPDDRAAAEGLVLAQRDQERSIIVDPFVTTKDAPKDGRPTMTLRDSIRAYGPTIRYQSRLTGRAS